MPASAGEMRPSGSTADASVNTRPAPPRANDPSGTRCHGSGMPSVDEYWHIGETQTRLRISRSRSRMGVNSWLIGPEASREPCDPPGLVERLRGYRPRVNQPLGDGEAAMDEQRIEG